MFIQYVHLYIIFIIYYIIITLTPCGRNSPAAQSEPTTSAPHHGQPASSSYATAMRVHHASQNTNVNVLFSSSALPASFPVFVRRTTSQRMDPTVLYTMTFFETFSILLKKIWFRFICIFLNMKQIFNS